MGPSIALLLRYYLTEERNQCIGGNRTPRVNEQQVCASSIPTIQSSSSSTVKLLLKRNLVPKGWNFYTAMMTGGE